MNEVTKMANPGRLSHNAAQVSSHGTHSVRARHVSKDPTPSKLVPPISLTHEKKKKKSKEKKKGKKNKKIKKRKKRRKGKERRQRNRESALMSSPTNFTSFSPLTASTPHHQTFSFSLSLTWPASLLYIFQISVSSSLIL